MMAVQKLYSPWLGMAPLLVCALVLSAGAMDLGGLAQANVAMTATPSDLFTLPHGPNPAPAFPLNRSRADLGAPAPPAAKVVPKTKSQRLDDLFAHLQVASDADEAAGLERAIQALWLESGSDTADVLMDRALNAWNGHNTELCLALLDKVVVIAPNWAEVWNKRATIRFYAGDDAGAMADIAHVLKLEPRHFGALMGMGGILQKTHQSRAALAVYRKVLEINPQQPDLPKAVEDLELEVDGQGI